MKTPLRYASWALCLAAVLSISTPSSASWWWWKRPVHQPNLIERLEREGRFTTLLSLLDGTGLTHTIANEGPFTIYAPNDDAFAELLAPLTPEQVEALLANTELLKAILFYHVSPGKLSAFKLLRRNVVDTLGTSPVLALREHRAFLIQNARVKRANLYARNGIIHEIRSVLQVPDPPVVVDSVVDVLRLDARGRFTTLLQALEDTGLDEVVASLEPVTLFAPTNEAFDAISDILPTLSLGQVAAVLQYHVVPGKKSALRLLRERKVETALGQSVHVDFRHGGLFIDQSRVINFNVHAGKSVIQTIDEVLIPDLTGIE